MFEDCISSIDVSPGLHYLIISQIPHKILLETGLYGEDVSIGYYDSNYQALVDIFILLEGENHR